MRHFILILIMLVMVSPVTAGIDNLTSDEGTSYIRWTWDYTNNTTTCDIYIDGTYVQDTTMKMYQISDLGEREMHTIALLNNNSTTMGTDTSQSYYTITLYWILLLLSLIFMFIGMFYVGEDYTTAIAFNIIFITIGTIFSGLNLTLSFGYHYVTLTYISLILFVMGIMFLVWKVGTMFMDWHERNEMGDL